MVCLKVSGLIFIPNNQPFFLPSFFFGQCQRKSGRKSNLGQTFFQRVSVGSIAQRTSCYPGRSPQAGPL